MEFHESNSLKPSSTSKYSNIQGKSFEKQKHSHPRISTGGRTPKGIIPMNADVVWILATVAFGAGFFDAIAGGGGLVTLPALLLAGLDPVAALGTNKFQAAAATVSAASTFARKRLIDWHEARWLVPLAMLGGAGGALLVSRVDRQWLEAAVPVLLIGVAVYFGCSPAIGHGRGRQRLSVALFSLTVAPLLGIYDGILGPGVGAFFMIGWLLLCGLPMVRAMGLTKLGNAASNTGALAVFMAKGVIIWPLALTMAVAAFAGAQLGARCALRVGPSLVRPMVVVVCCALAVKLLSAPANPLRALLAGAG
ncbi:MAG: TSUP family transporter [Burkholderiaceae bacterium]|nr:TSUP family transporter [Burkholderiaceae bacterium]